MEGPAVAHAGDLGITAASSDLSDLSDLSDGRGWNPRIRRRAIGRNAKQKKASSTVYAIKPELFYTGHLWFLILIAAAFLFFLLFTRKEGKPGSRGGSARVPVAEASPCAPKKGRAVAAKRPPGGERSVCGMSGRPIAAAPYVFAEFIRIPHTDHVRTPHDGFSCEHQADRTKSRHRRRCPLSRSRRSAREGTWGRRNAPRSHNTGSFIFRRRVFANPSSSVAQTVEEPFFMARDRSRGATDLCAALRALGLPALEFSAHQTYITLDGRKFNRGASISRPPEPLR